MRWPLLITVALAAWTIVDTLVGRVPGLPETVALVLGLALLAWASYDLSLQGFVAAQCRGLRDANAVALTFDDGPDPQTTPAVLDTLAARGARATFFLVGEKAAAHPALVKRIVQAGHEIGNHGARHDWRAMLTPARARWLIEQGRAAIAGAGGGEPTLFRPPYGVTTPALGSAVRELGVRVIGWSVRARDAAAGATQPAALAVATLARIAPGDIVLLHDAPERPGGRVPRGPAMLETLLAGLEQRGLAAVTVSQLLGD